MFSTMLDTDMKEAASGRIKVEDVHPETIGQMLDFIYKGEMFAPDQEAKVSDETIIELLHCADKYEIDELKKQFVKFMLDVMSPSNAIKFATALEQNRAESRTVDEFNKYCRK